MSSGSGRDERARERRRATGSQDRIVRSTTGPRQLITFVDSQDPNSRSTIQRHTAHHSNAQRRDARLQSLRSTNRPRILRWSRRQSAEVLSINSPASSHSSSSISPLPPAQQAQSPGADSSSNPLVVVRGTQSTNPIRPTYAAPTIDRLSPQRESAIQYLMDNLCQHSSHGAACEEMVAFARTDEACASLLLAYCISLRRHNGHSISIDSDINAARNYFNQGTALLRVRLSDPLTASADANIQAVLLLIAYTADYGSFDQVRMHTRALNTMISERGGPGEENYPPILALQLRSIGLSRFLHLTLDCTDSCEALLRFPLGLNGV